MSDETQEQKREKWLLDLATRLDPDSQCPSDWEDCKHAAIELRALALDYTLKANMVPMKLEIDELKLRLEQAEEQLAQAQAACRDAQAACAFWINCARMCATSKGPWGNFLTMDDKLLLIENGIKAGADCGKGWLSPDEAKVNLNPTTSGAELLAKRLSETRMEPGDGSDY